MKVRLMCLVCLRERHEGVAPSELSYIPSRDDVVSDNGVYDWECERGHRTQMIVEEEKFEVLFEVALNAIVDGYYREAVVSGAASLERFYEFFATVIAHEAKIPAAEFEAVLSKMAKQSERQFGAFMFAHLLAYKRAPLSLPQKKVEFRNDVVHKGEFPTRDKALSFLNAVFDVVVPTMAELRKSHHPAIIELHLNKQREKAAAVKDAVITRIGTTFNVRNHPDIKWQPSIEERLQDLERAKTHGQK